MSALPVVVVWGIKVTPVFLVAWLAALLLRRSSASRRHFVWTLAAVAALALPIGSMVSPRLVLPVLPSRIANDAPPTAPELAPSARAENAPAPAPVAASVVSAVDGIREASWVPAPLWLLWAAGTTLMGLWVGVSLAGTSALARRARLADDPALVDAFDEARRSLGVSRRVRLLLAPGDAMPMTWGLLRPVVLLPAGVKTWSPSRRRAVMMHELAHVYRGDWLTQLAARFVCALYWWHPLAWMTARRLREEREHACDDLVLTHGADAPDYASQLLEIARWLRAPRSTSLAGVAMARPVELAGRLLAVLDHARARAPVPRRVAISGAIVAVGLVVPLSGMRLARAEPPTSTAALTASRPQFDPTSDAGLRVATATQPDESPRAPVIGSAQAGRTLCDWSSIGRSQSSSTNIDDDAATIRIVVDGCELFVRSRGRVEFSDDDRTISQLASGGYFEIEERRDRERRRAEFESRGGSLDRRWFVNGSEQAWSADAGDWLHGALLAMFRRTSFEARARAERIHRRSGKAGLLDEIALLHSSSALGSYFTVLFERERLSPAEARRLATLAGERIRSSSELANVLVSIVTNNGVDEPTRIAVVQSAGKISSSSERARVLVAAVETGSLSSSLADAVLETTEGISSSSEKARVLVAVNAHLPPGRRVPERYASTASSISSSSELARVLVDLLQRHDLESEHVVAALEAARRISSSSEKARVLEVAVQRHGLDDRSRPSFFDAAKGISSSSERERVLLAVTTSGPDPASVGFVIESARGIASSSSRANVLIGVARAGLLTSDALRTAYRDAARSISSQSERERALKALGDA